MCLINPDIAKTSPWIVKTTPWWFVEVLWQMLATQTNTALDVHWMSVFGGPYIIHLKLVSITVRAALTPWNFLVVTHQHLLDLISTFILSYVSGWRLLSMLYSLSVSSSKVFWSIDECYIYLLDSFIKSKLGIHKDSGSVSIQWTQK